jgi:hypothetical protein
LTHREKLVTNFAFPNSSDSYQVISWFFKPLRCQIQLVPLRIAAAFATWVASTQDSIYMRGLLSDAVRHLSNMMVGKSFRRWCETTLELRDMRRAMNTAVKFITKRALVMGWRLWREVIEETHHQMEVATRALVGLVQLLNPVQLLNIVQLLNP